MPHATSDGQDSALQNSIRQQSMWGCLELPPKQERENQLQRNEAEGGKF